MILRRMTWKVRAGVARTVNEVSKILSTIPRILYPSRLEWVKTRPSFMAISGTSFQSFSLAHQCFLILSPFASPRGNNGSASSRDRQCGGILCPGGSEPSLVILGSVQPPFLKGAGNDAFLDEFTRDDLPLFQLFALFGSPSLPGVTLSRVPPLYSLPKLPART